MKYQTHVSFMYMYIIKCNELLNVFNNIQIIHNISLPILASRGRHWLKLLNEKPEATKQL